MDTFNIKISGLIGWMGIKKLKTVFFSGFQGAKYTKNTVFEGRILHKSAYIQAFTQKEANFVRAFRLEELADRTNNFEYFDYSGYVKLLLFVIWFIYGHIKKFVILRTST